MKRSWIFVLTALTLGGCSKSEQPAPAPVKETKPVQPSPAAATPKEEPLKPLDLEALKKPEGLDQECERLHAVMKERVEGIKQRRGPKPEDKPFPSKETFVEGCGKLPPGAVRCMIPDVVRKNHMECQVLLRQMSKEESEKVRAFRATLL